MTERLPSVWASRDYPVLVDVARRIDAGQEVAATTGLSIADVRRAAFALQRTGYLTMSDDSDDVVMFDEVLPSAYVATGLHPGGDALASLVAALTEAAEQAADEDEKSRLQRAASSLMDVGRGVAGGVVTAWLTGYLPH